MQRPGKHPKTSLGIRYEDVVLASLKVHCVLLPQSFALLGWLANSSVSLGHWHTCGTGSQLSASSYSRFPLHPFSNSSRKDSNATCSKCFHLRMFHKFPSRNCLSLPNSYFLCHILKGEVPLGLFPLFLHTTFLVSPLKSPWGQNTVVPVAMRLVLFTGCWCTYAKLVFAELSNVLLMYIDFSLFLNLFRYSQSLLLADLHRVLNIPLLDGPIIIHSVDKRLLIVG